MTKQLPTILQQFVYKSRYARWLPEENRRENWDETVARYFNFFEGHLKESCNYTLAPELRKELEEAVLNLEVMPSMRCLMTAGEALERCNVAGYNCAYISIDHPRAFDECLYVLMCGTGVGFTVEQDEVENLPIVNEHFEKSASTIIVEDSKQGWAKGLRELIAMLYVGQIPSWDLSKLRPAGARLKTFGGRSSGPAPLNELFEFVVEKFTHAKGRKLTPLECHDIFCKIGDVVVVGGVRRSALISLSDFSDTAMRNAKSGAWWQATPYRALANNSAVYKTKPDLVGFLGEWASLINSKSGERGMFNRQAANKQAAKSGRRETYPKFGTNPCSEIILRSNQFCNLSEVVIRAEDDLAAIERKIILATILGTFQSTLTNFKYLRKIWSKNTEEERLLGVSLTGILDNKWMANKYAMDYGFTDKFPDDSNELSNCLEYLKGKVVETNKIYADSLGISVSVATTCVKPSGTVSQLVDSASGIHPRHSEYYIRTVRGDIKDPLTTFLIASGIPNEPCVRSPDSTVVFSFPVEAPEDAMVRDDLTALNHLRLWKIYQDSWCEHKPSVTINVKDEEWIDVGGWVYNNFDDISGISFLPFSEHTYKQAPYQACDSVTYLKLLAKMPTEIDWNKLKLYEQEDNTNTSQNLACTGDVCEIIDIAV